MNVRLKKSQSGAKQGDRPGAQALGDAGLIQHLVRAVNDAAKASSNTKPTPQNVVDAVGDTLGLRACATLFTQHAANSSVAAYIPDDGLRQALTRAYTDQSLAVDIFQEVRPSGQPVSVRDWHGSASLPQYLLDILAPDQWTMSLELHHRDDQIGLLWMLGAAASERPPPDPAVVRVIAELASASLIDTIGLERARRQATEFHLLEELSNVLSQERPLQERLDEVVKRAQEATEFASVELLTPDPTDRDALITALYTRDVGFVRSPVAQRIPRERLDRDAQYYPRRPGPLLIREPHRLPELTGAQRDWMIRNEVRFLVTVPLVHGSEYWGTLRICSPFLEDQTWERLQIFTTLGSHIAAILKNALLLVQVERAHERLSQSHHATVRMLAQAAEARDTFTGEHLRRMELYVHALARELGLSDIEVQEVGFGAVVHDVGKLRIPDSILLKPSPLNEQEWALVRKHPHFGEEILAHADIPEAALQITRWHHERWDGSGYPDGLRGEAIPLAVQLTSLADVFDALTSVRPYKPAWPAEQAYAEVLAGAGTQFAPRAVEAFEALWRRGTVRSILEGTGERQRAA